MRLTRLTPFLLTLALATGATALGPGTDNMPAPKPKPTPTQPSSIDASAAASAAATAKSGAKAKGGAGGSVIYKERKPAASSSAALALGSACSDGASGQGFGGGGAIAQMNAMCKLAMAWLPNYQVCKDQGGRDRKGQRACSDEHQLRVRMHDVAMSASGAVDGKKVGFRGKMKGWLQENVPIIGGFLAFLW